MNNLREVNNDILKDWLLFREDEIASLKTDEDKRHWIYFDEISERILKRVPNKDKKYVEKQLGFLDKNFMDYLSYWNEKYYRNGFCDGIELMIGSLDI
mgnify:CR=1 FL=1